MSSVYFKVDQYDTVTECMIECMKAKEIMRSQNIKSKIKTNNDQYGHVNNYELIFKNMDDYTVYQLVK